MVVQSNFDFRLLFNKVNMFATRICGLRVTMLQYEIPKRYTQSGLRSIDRQ